MPRGCGATTGGLWHPSASGGVGAKPNEAVEKGLLAMVTEA
jgi:hypothetical protein